MSGYDYDLFVIGGGSGGTRASRIAAGFGARVAVAEERYLGGTCVNVGCVPKKLLVYASEFAEHFDDAAGFGWTVGDRAFDWSQLIANKDQEIARLNGIYRRMIEGAGATIYDAHAKILDAHTIDVGGKQVTTDKILIAVGGWPSLPQIPGIEHAFDSNDVFYLKDFPKRCLIVGGGYIAVEFAGVFNGLGANVTQTYRGPMFLRGFDDDVRHALAEEMGKRGVDLRFNANVSRIDAVDGGLRAELVDSQGAVSGSVDADAIIYAIGRRPKTEDLGLENINIELDANGAIVVDKLSKTSVDNIYAVGDITDRINLTPVAIREGHCFAETVFNNNPIEPDHSDVATAVFSQPTIGTCGLTETQAREQYGDVVIYRSAFRPMKHTLSGRDERALMKLIVDRASDRVVGCHILGEAAGEIMQGIGIAIKCGATKAQFDATIGIHPTAAEELVTMRTPVEEPALAAD
ncbi:MAG: glutathione-disulfide reductase [Gammaproteobacteria bacterium]|nr:glutathione-disulfide reductase [Gammaproteobacteria bacterium]